MLTDHQELHLRALELQVEKMSEAELRELVMSLSRRMIEQANESKYPGKSARWEYRA